MSQSRSTGLALDGTRWRFDDKVVNAGSSAEGLLVNVRMVNAVFEDVGPLAAARLPAGFDPDANTDRFISQLSRYASHGVNAFTLGLQGGMPGYEGAVNSAFDADGSLLSPYLDRVARVIDAAADVGCAVVLSCLYQRQQGHERALSGKPAIHSAVANTASWIADAGFTNVALEVANEFAHAGYRTWPDGEWLRSPQGQVELIATARHAAPDLLVSTSGMGGGSAAQVIADAVDFLLIHFNNTATDDIPARVGAARAFGKAVVCNEDDKVGVTGAEAARLSIGHGAGWGFMHSARNQYAPFAFDGLDDDPAVYTMLSQLTTPSASIDAAREAIPFALITRPKDGDTFASSAAIEIHVGLSGARPGHRVTLFAGDTAIGRRDTEPWYFSWPGPPAGRHDLIAVAHDGKGNEVARSRPVDIVVE